MNLKEIGWTVFGLDLCEIFVLLVLYAASNGSFVPTFRDNLSIPFKGQAVQEGSVEVAGCFEQDNGLSDFMKCGGLLD